MSFTLLSVIPFASFATHPSLLSVLHSHRKTIQIAFCLQLKQLHTVLYLHIFNTRHGEIWSAKPSLGDGENQLNTHAKPTQSGEMTGACSLEQLGRSNEARDQLLLSRFGVLFMRLPVAREGREKRSQEEEEWINLWHSSEAKCMIPFCTVVDELKGIRYIKPVAVQLERQIIKTILEESWWQGLLLRVISEVLFRKGSCQISSSRVELQTLSRVPCLIL